jgi:hypothetical protein
MGPLLIAEGSKVSYVGDGDADLRIGDRGKVIASDGGASHVRWLTGGREGDITLMDNLEIVANDQPDFDEDGLDSGHLVSFGVRAVFDRHGRRGLLNAMENEGHLTMLQPFVEETIQHITSRIRRDPSMVEVLASLDPEDGDEFVLHVATFLLREALSEE